MSRKFSRQVRLTTTFMALAAGGTAACDEEPDVVEEDHVFYCATADGTVVDEDYCDDSDDHEEGHNYSGSVFIFHSSTGTYAPSYTPGTKLPTGGRSFPYGDRNARMAVKLPPAGKITNGSTVKIGVVGKGGAPAAGRGSGGG